jgi:hypothetical protein
MELIKKDYQDQNAQSLETCLKIDKQELYVHKFILQRCSDYFKAFFIKKKKTVSFDKNFEYKIIKAVFDILYDCDTIENNTNNLLGMYLFCDKFLIISLKQKIATYLINNFESISKKYHHGIIDVFKITNNYDIIYDIIKKYILDNDMFKKLKVEMFLTFDDFKILKHRIDDSVIINKLYEHNFISILSYLNHVSDIDLSEYKIIELNDKDIIYQIFKKVKSLEKLKEIIALLKKHVHDIIKNSINELYQNNMINLYFYLSFHTDQLLDEKLTNMKLIEQVFQHLEDSNKGHLVASITKMICISANINILPKLDNYKYGLKSIITWDSYIESERIMSTLFKHKKITSDTYLNRRTMM